MVETERHPSFLQLDRISLGDERGEWREHLERCQACSAYVERQRRPVAVPEWTRNVARPRKILPWAVFATVVAAAAGVIVLVPTLSGPPGRVAEKGTPAVALYVKRGDAVSLWDGRESLAPGDRIQLEVVPDDFRHVAVALRARSGVWQPLYRGEVQGMRARIPESWRLDEAPGPESLGIAFSRRALSDSELREALEHEARDPLSWTTVLALPKAAASAQER